MNRCSVSFWSSQVFYIQSQCLATIQHCSTGFYTCKHKRAYAIGFCIALHLPTEGLTSGCGEEIVNFIPINVYIQIPPLYPYHLPSLLTPLTVSLCSSYHCSCCAASTSIVPLPLLPPLPLFHSCCSVGPILHQHSGHSVIALSLSSVYSFGYTALDKGHIVV